VSFHYWYVECHRRPQVVLLLLMAVIGSAYLYLGRATFYRTPGPWGKARR